jgi:hypothetical protein
MTATPKPASIVLMGTLVITIAGGIWLASSAGPEKQEGPGTPQVIASDTVPQIAALPASSAAVAAADASASAVDVSFDQRNLFSIYQLALGSSDLRTIEAGLGAFRSCSGYMMASGGSSLESWVNFVMPEGLSPQERERRTRRALASAGRCTGFLEQDISVEAKALNQKALQLGSPSEELMQALHARAAEDTPASRAAQAEASCRVVRDYPGADAGVRRITVSMRDAAEARSSHMLNQLGTPPRNIALNLALCDLDPEGCTAHSNVVGSACMQSGKCDYNREEDYWQANTTPEVFSAAQGLRHQIVASVKSGNCDELFK